MSYRYWHFKDDPEGRRFCFATAPLMTCPLATPEAGRVADDEPWAHGIAEAAATLGLAPADLAAVLRRAHQRTPSVRRVVDGRKTKLCATCGHKLTDHGYSAWVERDRRADEDEGGSVAIAARLGMMTPAYQLKAQSNLKRSEARQWAHDEYVIAQNVMEEARR